MIALVLNSGLSQDWLHGENFKVPVINKNNWKAGEQFQLLGEFAIV